MFADGAHFPGSSDPCHTGHFVSPPLPFSATSDAKTPSADLFLAMFEAAKLPKTFIRAVIHKNSVKARQSGDTKMQLLQQ